MITVSIVDDDINVRQFLRESVAWEKLGFEVIWEAPNGKKAFSNLQQNRPDVIILDLEMPVMDGVAFLSLFEKGHLPWTIVLSCHDEFHYVKSALQLDAFDYLLKHMLSPSALENILQKLKSCISNQEAPLLAPSQGDLPFIDLANHQYDTAEQWKRAFSSVGFSGEYVWAFFLRPDFSATEKDYLSMCYTICNRSVEHFNQKRKTVILRKDAELFYLASEFATEDDADCFYSFLQNTQNHIKNMYDCTISICYYPVRVTQKDLIKTWTALENGLSMVLYDGPQMLRSTDNIHMSQHTDLLPMLRQIQKDFSDPIQTERNIDLLFQQIYQAHLPAEELEFVLLSVVHTMLHYLHDLKEKFQNMDTQLDLFEKTILTNTHDVFKSFCFLFEYRHWLQQTVLNLYEFCNNSIGKHGREILKAIQYIEKNSAREISLQSTADAIGISKSYLSRIFKEETGKNFSLYLRDHRLQIAKEMLKETDDKVYCIAYETGFQSHYHFNNLFKKKYRVTPLEYRKSCSEKDQHSDV